MGWLCAGANMAVDHHIILGADLPQLVPVGVVNAGETVEGWVVREADRLAALGDHALDLIDHQFTVPDGQQGQGNDSPRVGAGPFVDMPVVIGFDHAFGALFVLCLVEQVAGKGREGWEADRGENAIGVHVTNTFVDRVDSLAHVFIAQWLHAVLFLGPAYHRVESHIAYLLALVEPKILAIFFHQAGRDGVQFFLGHVLVEHFRGFNNVVIYTDQYHVFEIHGELLCFCGNRFYWVS